MALESSRRLVAIAYASLLVWFFAWLWALVFIPFKGAQFWYLFFGIAEPLIFLLVVFTNVPASLLFIVIAVQFGLHIVAAILRILSLSIPIVGSELLLWTFVVLELVAVGIYLVYTYNAFRYATAVDTVKQDKDK